MFLVNSRLKSFAAAQRNAGQALLRTYDRCFAEFLNEGSLVHLRILILPTCVGLRYGYTSISPRSFSGRSCLFFGSARRLPLYPFQSIPLADLPTSLNQNRNVHTNKHVKISEPRPSIGILM